MAPGAFVPWHVLRADKPPASEAGDVPDVVSRLFSALGGLTVARGLEEPPAAAAWEPERGTPSPADGRECGGGVRVAVDGFGEHTPLEGGRASGRLSGVRTCSPWHGPAPGVRRGSRLYNRLGARWGPLHTHTHTHALSLSLSPSLSDAFPSQPWELCLLGDGQGGCARLAQGGSGPSPVGLLAWVPLATVARCETRYLPSQVWESLFNETDVGGWCHGPSSREPGLAQPLPTRRLPEAAALLSVLMAHSPLPTRAAVPQAGRRLGPREPSPRCLQPPRGTDRTADYRDL